MVDKSKSPLPAHLCDTHVHTRLCGHATGEMAEYVESAINKGLKRIIFLEHMEEGIFARNKTWLSENDFEEYFSTGIELKKRYQTQIDVGLGVECGYNPEHWESLCSRLGKRRWAQIGVSCHFLKVEGKDYHLNLLSRKEENIRLARQVGPEHLLDRYFSNLIEAVDRLPGTMLCHLDAALRFLPELRLTEFHFEQIDRLLQAVRSKNMVIELNSSGFDIRKEQFPTGRILEMAHSYDIPFVYGSDAHRPEDVGRYFDVLNALPL